MSGDIVVLAEREPELNVARERGHRRDREEQLLARIERHIRQRQRGGHGAVGAEAYRSEMRMAWRCSDA